MTGVFFALALLFSPTHGILFKKVKTTFNQDARTTDAARTMAFRREGI
jgi:hypothetical protein